MIPKSILSIIIALSIFSCVPAKKYSELESLQKTTNDLLNSTTVKLNLSEEEKAQSVNFAQLMEKVAQISPKLRVRFSTSHPKDMTDEFLYVMAKYDNICKYIHLPVQSGSNRMLEMMNRGYTRE